LKRKPGKVADSDEPKLISPSIPPSDLVEQSPPRKNQKKGTHREIESDSSLEDPPKGRNITKKRNASGNVVDGDRPSPSPSPNPSGRVKGESRPPTPKKPDSPSLSTTAPPTRPLGLHNIGNSCYLNSALQCLFRVKSLTGYLLFTDWQSDINPKSPFGSGGRVVRAYQKLVSDVFNSHGCLSAREVKAAVAHQNETFSDFGQHDATEFLITILDAIHEDLNQSEVARGADIDTESYSGMDLHRICNRSIICRLFHGESHTTLEFECGHRQDVNEPLAAWALPLPTGKKRLCLEDCIRCWEMEHEMNGDNGLWCPVCDDIRDVRRKIKVVKFAPVILVQLKRFKQTFHGVEKNTIPVDYPLQLNTNCFAQEGTGIYELTGVICHCGTLYGGHYTCLVRNLDDLTQWYDISDSCVTRRTDIESNGRRCDQSAMSLIYQNPFQ
jgi:ubiquitin C-terminal hydrolase